MGVALLLALFELEEALVGVALDLGQRGHGDRVAALGKIAHVVYNHQVTPRAGTQRLPQSAFQVVKSVDVGTVGPPIQAPYVTSALTQVQQ
ncbi:MAG: hypothetical protein ACYTEY_18095, partial [Planctomycetota bacterium]